MQISEFTPGIAAHSKLNPLLWENDRLKPDVRLALLHIAHKFEQFVGIPLDILDRVITGSNTTYTYTAASDLDLHLIVDHQSVKGCDQPVAELFDAKRKLWKEQHDIDILGIPVECYVEDLNNPVRGHVYSVDSDQWVSHRPNPITVNELPPEVVEETQRWIVRIHAAIASRNIAVLQQTGRLLRDYRSRGLGSGGELSRENIVYKTLRNNGVIRDLARTIRHIEDKALSLSA